MSEKQPEKVEPAVNYIARCKSVRKALDSEIGRIDSMVARVKKAQYTPLADSDVGETIANLMLAKRHLEDARQRIGLSIKAWDGGRSVYKD